MEPSDIKVTHTIETDAGLCISMCDYVKLGNSCCDPIADRYRFIISADGVDKTTLNVWVKPLGYSPGRLPEIYISVTSLMELLIAHVKVPTSYIAQAIRILISETPEMIVCPPNHIAFKLSQAIIRRIQMLLKAKARFHNRVDAIGQILEALPHQCARAWELEEHKPGGFEAATARTSFIYHQQAIISPFPFDNDRSDELEIVHENNILRLGSSHLCAKDLLREWLNIVPATEMGIHEHRVFADITYLLLTGVTGSELILENLSLNRPFYGASGWFGMLPYYPTHDMLQDPLSYAHPSIKTRIVKGLYHAHMVFRWLTSGIPTPASRYAASTNRWDLFRRLQVPGTKELERHQLKRVFFDTSDTRLKRNLMISALMIAVTENCIITDSWWNDQIGTDLCSGDTFGKLEKTVLDANPDQTYCELYMERMNIDMAGLLSERYDRENSTKSLSLYDILFDVNGKKPVSFNPNFMFPEAAIRDVVNSVDIARPEFPEGLRYVPGDDPVVQDRIWHDFLRLTEQL